MINNWEDLEKECLQCEKCKLSETRTKVVFGVGNKESKVLLIGEGPGENEDLQGEPFVGRGGKLLDKMLNYVDLDRKENIYIANIVKCRPPKNRDPLEEEQTLCKNWLRNQIYLIKPKIIMCLGRIAAQVIIKKDIKITRDHGILFYKEGGNLFNIDGDNLPENKMILMATLHPAALLRNPAQKQYAMEDFKKLRSLIEKLKLI